MSTTGVSALVLAAGKGTRMHSRRPKVMQRVLGEPMLWYVYRAVEETVGSPARTVVGHGADELEKAFPEMAPLFVRQEEQLGTGHALQCAWGDLRRDGGGAVLVVNGDTPFLHVERLRSFVQDALSAEADVAFLSLVLADAGSYGRVVRDAGGVRAIVEAKDFDEALHGPVTNEINAGIYLLRLDAVEPLLAKLRNENKSGEYYITDLVGLGIEAGLRVMAFSGGGDAHFLGVNSPAELVGVEERMRAAIVDGHLRGGVLIRQPESVRIGPKVVIAPGVELTGPCELYGATRLEREAVVQSHCVVVDSMLREGCEVRSFCHVEKADVGPGCLVGPYARLRPGAVLEEEAHAGNFVELKNATLGRKAKANHLTYLGDASVGAGSNVGAGTITCNYDGRKKHRTTIGENAFIGSNTSLVAPVEIGPGALVGAGSVVTKDVPAETLAVARAKQKHFERKRS